ncbi:MAG: hypothetical protein MJ123_11260, partial [Lachnospiraceae bacterium]|nr:hypothetical protein [Lachnospiraceae bacterium]
MMDNKENKNQIEETQDIDAEYEEGSKSPFLLIYALIVFLAVLVGVGLWIVKSISADRPVDNTQISASTVTSTSTSDTNSPASTIGGEDAPVIEANDKPLVGKEEKIQQLTKMDKERLTSEQYEGVFLKMHNLSAIDDKLFEKFRGLHIVCTEGMVYNAEDILTALDMIFGNSRTMPQMYMEIDPYDFWISAGANDNEKEASISRILRYVETHPETTFEIMYSFPNIEYWNSLSDEQLSSCQEIYYHVTNRFLSYDNVIVYGPGNSDWLTVNRNNYTSLYVPNADVLTKVFINCFCDRDYQLKLEDVLKWFSDVKYISDSDKLGMYKHELPQGSKIVLLGDNTITGYTTAGVAGTLAYMTGAKV